MDQSIILGALMVSLIVGPSVVAIAALAVPWRAMGRGVRDGAVGRIRTLVRPLARSRTSSPAADPVRTPPMPAARSSPPPAFPGPDDPADGPLVDRETGLASRRAWDQVMRHEENRFARYGRPVTLLVAELEGFEALASQDGQAAADRLVPPVAAALYRSARVSDFIARTGRARFAALLPETDEVAAINYAERVCADSDAWLEARGEGLRLAIGWAQPVAGACLSDAMLVAFDRMNADRRRPQIRQASAPIPARPPEQVPAAAATRVPREGYGFSGLKSLGTVRVGTRNDAA